MEARDALLFYHRKKFMIKGIQNYVADIDETELVTEPYKPTLADRLATALRKGPLSRALVATSKERTKQQQ